MAAPLISDLPPWLSVVCEPLSVAKTYFLSGLTPCHARRYSRM